MNGLSGELLGSDRTRECEVSMVQIIIDGTDRRGEALANADVIHVAAEVDPLIASSASAKVEGVSEPRASSWLQASCSFIWDTGPVCMATATVVFALSALGVKLLGQRLSVFQIVFVRSTSSLLAVCAIKWYRQSGPVFGSRPNYPLLACRGLFGAVAMTLFYLCIQLLPLGDAMSVFFVNASATAVAACLFGYETASWFIFAGCLTSLGGVVLLSHPPMLFGGVSWSMSRLMGVSAGLVSAMCAAGAFLSLRAIGSKEEAIVTTAWFHAAASASSAVPLLFAVPTAAVMPSLHDWAVLMGIASTSFWGQLLLARGFQILSASSAAAINLLQVVHAFILSSIFLDDTLHWYSVVGSVLIGGGAVLVNYKDRVPSSNDTTPISCMAGEKLPMPPASAELKSINSASRSREAS